MQRNQAGNDRIDELDANMLQPHMPGGSGGDIQVLEDAREIALLPLPSLIGSYILWLIVKDLLYGDWGRRRTRLTEESARAFALFLHDCLPPAYATDVPAPRRRKLN